MQKKSNAIRVIYKKIYQNGDEYIGGWKNGKKDGQGTLTYANGDEYKGSWLNDSKSGQGVYTDYSGGKYDGNFVFNKANGQGTLTYANGDKYTGNWNDGKKDGQGTITFANGNEYECAFANNKLICLAAINCTERQSLFSSFTHSKNGSQSAISEQKHNNQYFTEQERTRPKSAQMQRSPAL